MKRIVISMGLMGSIVSVFGMDSRAILLAKKWYMLATYACENGIVAHSTEKKISYEFLSPSSEVAASLEKIAKRVEESVNTKINNHCLVPTQGEDSSDEEIPVFLYKKDLSALKPKDSKGSYTIRDVSGLLITRCQDLVTLKMFKEIIKHHDVRTLYEILIGNKRLIAFLGLCEHYPFLKESPLELSTRLYGAEALQTLVLKNFHALYKEISSSKVIFDVFEQTLVEVCEVSKSLSDK